MLRLAFTPLVLIAACGEISPKTCGDGELQGREVCDGDMLADMSCEGLGFGEGALGCATTCLEFDTSYCGAPETCGNGELEPPEVCDGDNLGGETCGSQGFGEGTLTCLDNCGGFDTSGCDSDLDTCGDDMADPGEVCDGTDLNGASCDSLGEGIGELACQENCGGYDTSDCMIPSTQFELSPTTWPVPEGGEYLGGFDGLGGSPGGSDYNAQGHDKWTTLDINGDGRPDLIITARAVERSGYYWWARVPGHESDPHWLVHLNNGSGFDATPVSWSVPDGGKYLAGFDDLFGSPGASDYNAQGHDKWSTLDMNGDGLPDLVITAQAVERSGYYWWAQVPGLDSDPHWLVHLNNGSGFDDTPVTWSVPDGGEYLAGFDDLGGTAGGSDYNAVGYDKWSTSDMNGDGRPDLVITGEAVSRSGYYHWNRVPGFDSSPHWLVHLNNGSGFDPSPVTWSVPGGGEYLAGFDDLHGRAGGSDYGAVGYDNWSTTDIDGDGLQDLVITGRAVERSGYYHWNRVPGYDTNPHWLVHFNNGSGFDTGAVDWPVPVGGEYLAGFDGLSGTAGGSDYNVVGHQSWTTVDIDGDGLRDLVVPGVAVERSGYYHWNRVPGFESVPHWLVYFNNGNGFNSSSSQWAVPSGGEYLAGFDALTGTAGGSDYNVVGHDNWTSTDLDGDGRMDIVVTGVAVERSGYYHWNRVPGYDSSPHWNVFYGTP